MLASVERGLPPICWGEAYKGALWPAWSDHSPAKS